MQSARHFITVALIIVVGALEAFLLTAGQTHG